MADITTNLTFKEYNLQGKGSFKIEFKTSFISGYDADKNYFEVTTSVVMGGTKFYISYKGKTYEADFVEVLKQIINIL